MPCKLVLFFQQVQSGWSETWYYLGSSDPRQCIIDQLTSDNLQKMVTFRHPLTYLIGARATALTGSKNSYSVQYADRYKGTKVSTYSLGPDPVSTDAVVAVDAVQVGRKRMFVRGLNDDDVNRDKNGFPDPSSYLLQGVANYINTMQASNMGIRILTQPPNGGLVWYPCIKVSPVTGDIGHTDIITSKAVGAEIQEGGQVRFGRIPFDELPGFPANPRVVAVNPGGNNGVRIAYYLREQATITTTYLQMTGLAYTYVAVNKVAIRANTTSITPVLIERFSEHKTGRPFGQLRGRVRVKVKAL